MAFPAVVGSPVESAETGTVTTHTVNLPSLAPGSLALVLFTCGVAVTLNALAGWDELTDVNTRGDTKILYRRCDGTEGASITLTTSATTRSASIVYEISGAENPAVQAPELSTVATGTSTTPSPTACTPTGGAKDYLWIAEFSNTTGEEADDDTWCNSAPTSYGSLVQKSSGTLGTNVGAMIASATRAFNASSEDPSTFSQDASLGWRAFTIAIHPAVEPEPPFDETSQHRFDIPWLRY